MYEGSSASSVSISASRSAAVDFAWLDAIHAARIWSAASIITSGETISPPTQMSIRLDPDLKDILQELANAEDRSLNSYISRALRKHVEAIKRRPKAKS